MAGFELSTEAITGGTRERSPDASPSPGLKGQTDLRDELPFLR